jgi:hypothetical protein
LPASPSVHVARYRSIASALAERLLNGRGSDPLAPWSDEVIVPSRGMAEAIGAEIVARLPHGVAGLHLRFLDDLAQAIVNAAGEFPRVATDIERRLAMRLAVRTVEHPMMEGRGIAAMLDRSYRDLRDSGLTLDDFAARSKATRSKLIVRAWREYERLIASFGAIDGADLLRRATVLASRVPVRPQLLAGFYDMTGVQLQFVKALPVAAVWVPTDMPFAKRFVSEWTGEPPAAQRENETRRSEVSAASFDTRHSELRCVCASIAGLLSRGETSIGIVARSLEPYDVRLINRFAAEFGFATTLVEETPLSAHRIGRAGSTLLRLRDRGFPRGEVLELVRDGLHLRTRIDVDDVDPATRRARIAGGTSGELAPLRNRSRSLDAYIALVAELEELTASLDPSRLGSLVRIETDDDLAAAEALDEIALAFERAGAFHDTPSLIDAINNATLRRQPKAESRDRVVWAGPLLPFRGRTFDHLFVVGMQDDVFPQRRTEDPLIPDAERARAGIREIGDGADEERLLFQLLLDSAEQHVWFTHSTGDGFGKVLRPSRFVRTIPQLPLPIAREASEVEAHAPSLRQLQVLVKSGTESPFDGYIPSLAPILEPKLRALTPTQLENFGECPHKFLLKYVLDVRDLDHPERELQVHHRDKGTLDHAVLERFYSELTSEDYDEAFATLPRLPERLAARLATLVDEAFDRHEQDVPPFNQTVRSIERRATQRLLREFVADDLGELAVTGLRPVQFEYQFGSVTARRQAPKAPAFTVDTGNEMTLRVEGTIDRIDRAGTKFRIVDYKSGKGGRHNELADKIDRGVRLQLALYAMAVTKIFDVGPENVSGTIKPLVRGEKPKFAFALEEKQDRLLETLRIFTNAICEGVFPAFPGKKDDFDSCKYCPVNHSCRTKHDLDERYAIQRREDPRTLLAGDGE